MTAIKDILRVAIHFRVNILELRTYSPYAPAQVVICDYACSCHIVSTGIPQLLASSNYAFGSFITANVTLVIVDHSRLTVVVTASTVE